jgi:hypothetical protein
MFRRRRIKTEQSTRALFQIIHCKTGLTGMQVVYRGDSDKAVLGVLTEGLLLRYDEVIHSRTGYIIRA